jgi:carboxymethylenebutenolidase
MNSAMTTHIQIATPDGPCTVEIAKPDGKGPWPAVIVFFDAAGLRPAATHIAERIAASGYLALQPDLFHRSPPLSELLGCEPTLGAMVQKVFSDPAMRAKFFTEYASRAVNYASLEKTIGTLLDHIAGRDDVRGGVGTTGYCMGGAASFRSATIFGNRIAATAAFHPGMLVTDQPDSPHLRSKSIKSRVYLGLAEGDLTAENEAKLRAELDAAGVRFEIEHYDAKHGYAVDDSPAYDAAAAERHYEALTRLYRETL